MAVTASSIQSMFFCYAEGHCEGLELPDDTVLDHLLTNANSIRTYSLVILQHQSIVSTLQLSILLKEIHKQSARIVD